MNWLKRNFKQKHSQTRWAIIIIMPHHCNEGILILPRWANFIQLSFLHILSKKRGNAMSWSWALKTRTIFTTKACIQTLRFWRPKLFRLVFEETDPWRNKTAREWKHCKDYIQAYSILDYPFMPFYRGACWRPSKEQLESASRWHF